MKKVFSITAFLLFGAAVTTHAQTMKKVTDDIDSTGMKVAHKTAEVASKGKAAVTDQVYKDATGPNGETVYMDNHARYYWIDKKGHRQYTEKADLKPKS
jgi:predicted small secreted protein